MAYGMEMQEFWESNPRILKIYAAAYAERRKLLDEQMWSMGQYIHIATYIAIGKAFNNNKEHPFNVQYPDRPFSWPQRTEEEISEEEADRELRKMLAAEDAWIREEKRMGLPEFEELGV